MHSERLLRVSPARPRACRRRWRGHARGAVFVEAIIVCSVLIVFLMGGLFLHRVYAVKLGSLRDARAHAWQQALEGCSGNLDIGAMFKGLVALGPPATLTPPPMSQQIGAVDHKTGTADATVTGPAALGGKRYDLGGSVQLACNEQIQGERGDLLDIALYAAQNFLPSFF